MASELDVWWDHNYEKYSLQALESWDLYAKFLTFTQPFQRRERSDFRESFQNDPKVNVYVCEAGAASEKLAHIPAAETWMYENHSNSAGAALTWTTWKNPYSEWGQITTSEAEKTTKESWKTESGVRIYEKVTIQGDTIAGQRHGWSQSLGNEAETWTERSLQSPLETRFERSWKQPGSSGGEVRGRHGNRVYGEYSFHSANASEKKQWSVEGGRDKGSCAGFTGKRKFTHKWDIGGSQTFEERSMQEGKRNWGVRRRTTGEKWLKEEWDGLPPTDPCTPLAAVYEKCVELLTASQATLRAFTDGDSSERRKLVAAAVNSLEDRHDPEAAAASITNVLKLALELEKLKQEKQAEPPPRKSIESSNMIEDLVLTHQELLRRLSASPLADQGLIESGLRVEGQVQAATDEEQLIDRNSELLRLLRDQTRVLQVFIHKLLNHEDETRRVLKQVKTHLDFKMSQMVEDCENEGNKEQMMETLSDIRTVSCVSDLAQVLSKLLEVLKPSATEEYSANQDTNFTSVQSLMVDLKFMAIEAAGILGVSEGSSAQVDHEALADPIQSLLQTGESVYRFLEQIRERGVEIEEMSHTEVATTEEVRSELSSIIQKKAEIIELLSQKLDTRNKIIAELNKELDDLRNVNRLLKQTDERLKICQVDLQKATERAESAEQRLLDATPQS